MQQDAGPRLGLEYYQWPFQQLMVELYQAGERLTPEHPVRRAYWEAVRPGFYGPAESRPFLESYARNVEWAMRSLISKRSVACWLHLVRRSFLMPAEKRNDSPRTRSLMQRTLTAAVQKYGRLELCETVAWSDEVPYERILRGRFVAFLEEHGIKADLGKQFVLTDFGLDEMKEYVGLCRLVYEHWLVSAQLRANGKGAGLFVNPAIERCFYQTPSEELQRALGKHDEREQAFASDCLGFVVSAEPRSFFPLPTFNADRSGLSAFGVERLPVPWKIRDIFQDEFQPNYSWAGGLDLASLCDAGRRFGAEFLRSKGYRVETCFAVLAALVIRTVEDWQEVNRFLQDWQRAYRGPMAFHTIVALVESALPIATRELGLSVPPSSDEIRSFLRAVSLGPRGRDAIDLASGKGAFPLVPCGEDAFFVDYSCILGWLFYLYRDVEISDQSFKGALLEQYVGRSELPNGRCTANDGTQREFDASFDVGGVLVLVECKAFGWHPGVEVGDPTILGNRAENLRRALMQVDSGARWLAANGRGRNFDVRRFDRILPVVVTPFVEFLPVDPGFWIDAETPRVLTPHELREITGQAGFRDRAARSGAAVPLAAG